MEISLNLVSINLSWRHHSTQSQSIYHGDITQPCLNQFVMETSLNLVAINLSWRHHTTQSQSICHGDITQLCLNPTMDHLDEFSSFHRIFSHFHKEKKASSIQCGYRKFKTHTLVLSPTLVNENSNNDVRTKNRGRRHAE